MSLDVSLYDPIIETENKLYCQSCGYETKHKEGRKVFDRNITHNLGEMAGEAGIYLAMWRPEEISAQKASHLIELLKDGIDKMKADPEMFKKFNPPNGWGNYEVLLNVAEGYLQACRDCPNAIIRASR